MALVAAALLATVVLVGGLGLSALVVGRYVFGGDRGQMMSEGHDGPGDRDGAEQDQRNRNGMGQRNRQGFGAGRGGPEGLTPGTPRGEGASPQGLGLGGALHGELTTADTTGAPVAMVFQVGEVTAYAAGKSLAVKSSDGFAATYTITSDTANVRAAAPTVGAQVRVVAAKKGLSLTRIVVIGQSTG